MASNRPKTGRKPALMHGLYARWLAGPESDRLEKLRLTDVAGEIAYLRTAGGRMAHVLANHGLGYDTAGPLDDSTLRTIIAQDRNLNTLLKYLRQYAIWSGEPNEYEERLRRGEFLGRQRRRVFEYLGDRTGQPGREQEEPRAQAARGEPPADE